MSTRIADLPDAAPPMMAQNTRMSLDSEVQNAYIPMNVHPNPYGNPVAPTSMDHPIPTVPMRSQQLTQEQQVLLDRTPMQQLPSRDIRMDTADYMQDAETIPNYIPPPKSRTDYVNDHERVVQETFDRHRREKQRESRLDMILTELQVPIMIWLMYFVFQLPFVNSLLNKYIPFITLYNTDGNVNFNGLVLKSVLFGSAYYSASQVIEYLTVI